jgi:hypothetical protein
MRGNLIQRMLVLALFILALLPFVLALFILALLPLQAQDKGSKTPTPVQMTVTVPVLGESAVITSGSLRSGTIPFRKAPSFFWIPRPAPVFVRGPLFQLPAQTDSAIFSPRPQF